jgi:hypothetical protein
MKRRNCEDQRRIESSQSRVERKYLILAVLNNQVLLPGSYILLHTALLLLLLLLLFRNIKFKVRKYCSD